MAGGYYYAYTKHYFSQFIKHSLISHSLDIYIFFASFFKVCIVQETILMFHFHSQQ